MRILVEIQITIFDYSYVVNLSEISTKTVIQLGLHGEGDLEEIRRLQGGLWCSSIHKQKVPNVT